jgi:hypothetical protein
MPIALRGISQISRRAQGNERFIAAQTWAARELTIWTCAAQNAIALI